ncbi:ribosome maturation factor RimP [candidate division KSB1 bacterium]|nr:ribosome maturation factor RimP [candidate division KSB1 bacterium]NIR70421.1 ribosome maturation factor RimP [candidate division KSB1 bacterium]NIS25961.1 ribosome maturation factor RimP [candidate division KSB1 bacterium]NIT69984.1 ribosome maturation factor RimP [candidate division KSB1 bacterium]NIU26649.1 ribosome maturation factor RimP [candidate division KSB1 bacterium]
MKNIEEQLKEILLPILEDERINLVDIQIKGKPGSQVFRVFVDTEGGITLNKCESISRQLSDELDMRDLIPGKYRLEVSSPGIDRPLVSRNDFRRNLARDVQLMYEAETEPKTFQGKIISVTDEAVEIQGQKETRIIPLSDIKKGKLCLPW